MHLSVEGSFQFEIQLFITIVHFFIFGSLEERSPYQKHVEDSAQREHVTDGLNVRAFGHLNDLWGNVAGSATPEEEVLLKI